MKKTYFLKPTMTFTTVTNLPAPDKSAVAPGSAEDRTIRQSVDIIAPAVGRMRFLRFWPAVA